VVVLLIAVWLVLPLGGCELADHAGESGWLAAQNLAQQGSWARKNPSPARRGQLG
jgi:hypothetical protein